MIVTWPFDKLSKDCARTLWTIHLLRKHIYRIFGPPSLLCKLIFSTKNKQNWHFLHYRQLQI